ncbi:uncharacterized protein LOC120495081 isoform X4 [Pimephales promelas]|uniref:uncharacterized protein LOC120495081 isoform X4 n=1 Tax=Pimephales promelas TaxID=90988 RepID=UPI001955D35F|nr:uncharacterized protein LOC120495081 isoform X4 [Pimephales promelas]
MLLNAHARVILQNERITLGGNSVVPSHFKDWFKMNERPLLAPTLKVGRKRKSVQERAEVKRKCEERRNLSRINIGSTIDRWRKLQGDLGLKTDAETADFLLSSYEKTAKSTPLVLGFIRPPPPAAVSTNLSDRKEQEIKSEGFGPWSSVSLKLEQAQEDSDGNDSSSLNLDIIQVKQEVPVQVKQEVPVQVKQEVPVQVKQEVPVQVKQEVPIQVKQELPIQVKQEVPVQVKQEDQVQLKLGVPVQVKQEDQVQLKLEVPVQVKQEDLDESEFWCMQQDPEMSGGVDASHPVPLTFNKLKEETDRYCGNVELLPSEDPVQTLKSEDLKTEEAIEEQSMDRKDPKVCSNSISNQTAHMQTNQVSSTTPQPVGTVSELAMKGQCENCLILAKVRDELQIQIAVLQNRIRAIICTKVSQHSVYSPHCDLDYEKLLKGFHKNCLSKNPLCKARENTTEKVNHVRDFILYMTKGYTPIKTLLFLDNMERIDEWVVTLQNGNMNVRHYLLDVLAFLKFLNRTSRPVGHLTRHSRNHISRHLRQKLKNIDTHKKPHKWTLKDSGNNPSAPKRRVNKNTS